MSPDLHYDAATAIAQGDRASQQDVVAADFPLGAGRGFAVLADGMGGHAAGDVAAGIVVTEVFSELKLSSNAPSPETLRAAADGANACLAAHVEAHPETAGMGATLVAPVFRSDGLLWISVGDSPLWLCRDGDMTRLNEDHSLAPQIDLMAASGAMDAARAAAHPDRNALTSVLAGRDIPRLDCPETPHPLAAGDIVLAASDGLQTLSEPAIRSILVRHAGDSAAAIAAILMAEVAAVDARGQDNVSVAVVRVASAPIADRDPSRRGGRSGWWRARRSAT